MRKPGFRAVIAGLVFWSAFSMVSETAVLAEKIPALAKIPADLLLDLRVQLERRRQALEKELVDFQAAAGRFNAKDAKDQSDAEYAALDARRTRYINAAKAFNKEVAEARALAHPPRKITPYTVQLGSTRGEFCIANSDGSRWTHTNSQAGRIARVDTGTRVTTGPTGRIRFVLPDETVFTIGPNSDMVIDEFVYDRENAEKISVTLTVGLFRWVTGKVARRDLASMKIRTPGVAGGIRGTDFETYVEADGSGHIKLFSGMLEITPRKGGALFAMKEKSMVKFTRDGTCSRPEPLNE